MILGFLGFALLAALSAGGPIGVVLGIAINVVILLGMLVLAFLSVLHLILHLADDGRSHTFGIRLINVLFGIAVFLGFAVLYLILVIAGSAILLPLLQ